MNSKFAIAVAVTLALMSAMPAQAEDAFPFGLEITLDVAPMPGSKRRPTLDIGDAGETRIELWCGGGRGQFSVAGNTLVFVAGANETRACAPAQTQADAALLVALAEATTWRRQDDLVTFSSKSTSLLFRINTN